MGAPVPQTINDFMQYNCSVVKGIIKHIEETPTGSPVFNIEGTSSDPNYLEAYDLDTIEYTHSITVEVIKFLYVEHTHYPGIFNENNTALSDQDR